MLPVSMLQRRLAIQRLAGPPFESPVAAVKSLVAVQSQEYADAKLRLSLRSGGAADSEIEEALSDGRILRTHVMRPTWHFVSREDIRWLLDLTGPRLIRGGQPYFRRVGLDDAILARASDLIARALAGGNYLTRQELKGVLLEGGIQVEGTQMLAHIMGHAEYDGLVCSGPRRGKQFTYALLDERAPNAHRLPREEALVELARRYFNSRGPADEYDFSWWSGLTVTDARRGLEAVRDELQPEVVDGKTYWSPDATSEFGEPSPAVYLLSVFDEFFSAYKGWGSMVRDEDMHRPIVRGNATQYVLVIDGVVAGTGRKLGARKNDIRLEVEPFRPLSRAERDGLERAVEPYGEYMGAPVTIAEA